MKLSSIPIPRSATPGAMFAQATPIARPPRTLAWWTALVLAALGWAGLGGGRARADVSGDSALKAVVLYNLATFVEWPSDAFAAADAPFVIGVLGDDPFGDVLDDAVKAAYVGRHGVIIRRFRRGEETSGCHLLFIAASERRRMGHVCAALQRRAILTVADAPGFLQAGGMVAIDRRGEELVLAVRAKALHAVGLTPSSKLLEIAEVVDAGAGPP